MIKTFLTSLIVIGLLVSPLSVFAQGEGSGGDSGSSNSQMNGNSDGSESNQNQVQTENQGEETQLKVTSEFQEKEGTATATENKGETTSQGKMDEVGKQLDNLLNSNKSFNGKADELKDIAESQKKKQSEMDEDLKKMEGKSSFAKFFFGPDYDSIERMKQKIEQNKVQIQKLEQIQTQLTNQEELDQIKLVIQAMVEQNTALQNEIEDEEEVFSLFGWLVRYFKGI